MAEPQITLAGTMAPTVELAKRNSKQRIDPQIDETPELRELVKPARAGFEGAYQTAHHDQRCGRQTRIALD